MLAIENLTKSYGGRTLFTDISFKINPKERVGLVGRNGHGKTTLFRIITEKESADSGGVSIPKLYSLGYVTQKINFTQPTILAECMEGLPETTGELSWKAEKVLGGLGFATKDFDSHPSSFSGGFQVRLNLAKVLVAEPDLLLLDEPTNYLDITSIRWLESFLINRPGEILLITHDRGFMDKVATHIVGLHRTRAKKIEGNTHKFYSQIAQEEDIYEKTRLNDEKKRKETELFISRFRAKARLANMVQSRIKTLQKMEKKDKLVGLKNLDFSFRSIPFNARFPLIVEDISFSYNKDEEESTLFENLSFSVKAGDRICVVGKNGKGKTTLLKVLSGDLKPDMGSINRHPGVVSGYYEQTNVKSLVDYRTVEEEILYAGGDGDRQTARNICGAMMFEGDDALKKISVLSGGEKSRIMLGKLLSTPCSLLILDEPTNHLDMESTDALLTAIDEFEGAVIMVTHNEMFLDAAAQRLIVFQGEKPFVFEGGYLDFLDRIGWDDEEGVPKKIKQDASNKKPGKKELKRLRSDLVNKRSKMVRPMEKRITAIEDRIDHLENELAQCNEKMQEAVETNAPDTIAELSRSISASEGEIDALFSEMEELSEERDSLVVEITEQLEALG